MRTIIIILLAGLVAQAGGSLDREIEKKAKYVERVLRKCSPESGRKVRRELADFLERFEKHREILDLARSKGIVDRDWEASVMSELASEMDKLSRKAREIKDDGNEESSSVVASAEAYADGGGYDEYFTGHGVPRNIPQVGLSTKKSSKGTHCVGFTLAVLMDELKKRGLLAGLSKDKLAKLQYQWYIRGTKGRALKSSEKRSAGMALKRLGIGREIEGRDAKPGDFVQMWRKSSRKKGHSAVFLGWIHHDGRKVGFRFRSSQSTTKGIGNWRAYFPGKAPAGQVPLKDYYPANESYFGRLNRK